jgi:hypothetical protein
VIDCRRCLVSGISHSVSKSTGELKLRFSSFRLVKGIEEGNGGMLGGKGRQRDSSEGT